jgi:hypothetical protein
MFSTSAGRPTQPLSVLVIDSPSQSTTSTIGPMIVTRVVAGRDSGHGRAMRVGRRTGFGRSRVFGLRVLVGAVATRLI